MNTNDVDIGSKIKEQRKKRGLTQKELAEKLRISVHALSKYEQNQRKPSMSTIKQIAAALEVPWITLLPYSQEDMEALENVFSELRQAGAAIGEQLQKATEPIHQMQVTMVKNIQEAFEKFRPTLEQLEEMLDHDVAYLLQCKEKAYYNGHLLSDEERRRALDMLKVLFPEYHKEGD
jgi:transcriptional regulator with XRE-family HTH domain